VKFCFLLGKSAAETVLMLQEACNEEALSKTQVYEWYSHFKVGKMSSEDQPRSGRPSTCRNDQNPKKFAMQSMHIVVGPLMRLLM
jgi:transposase